MTTVFFIDFFLKITNKFCIKKSWKKCLKSIFQKKIKLKSCTVCFSRKIQFIPLEIFLCWFLNQFQKCLTNRKYFSSNAKKKAIRPLAWNIIDLLFILSLINIVHFHARDCDIVCIVISRLMYDEKLSSLDSENKHFGADCLLLCFHRGCYQDYGQELIDFLHCIRELSSGTCESGVVWRAE